MAMVRHRPFLAQHRSSKGAICHPNGTPPVAHCWDETLEEPACWA